MYQGLNPAGSVPHSQKPPQSSTVSTTAGSATKGTAPQKGLGVQKKAGTANLFDAFGDFSSVPPKAKKDNDNDLFGDFSSVTPQKKAPAQKPEPPIQKKAQGATSDDLFGDFSAVAPTKKEPVKTQAQSATKPAESESFFGDFTSVEPTHKAEPEPKKDDKPLVPPIQEPEEKKKVGGGSINWSDMTAVNNLISVFKEADEKEAEEQKKKASTVPPPQVQQGNFFYGRPVQQPQQPLQQIQPQTQQLLQQPLQPQQTMPGAPGTFKQTDTSSNNVASGAKNTDDIWGAFEGFTTQSTIALEQKPVVIKKETEEAKIDDGWGGFEDAHNTAAPELPQQPPKAEEQKPKKADIFTNESLFDGVTPISVGISVDQKPAEVKKETEEVKIDDRWGDFEDAHNATVPELPPPLPDATQKSFPQNSVGATTEQKPAEAKKETEPKADDGWGDFEDAQNTAIHEVSSQQQPPKAEEQNPKKADIFTNESLFDGVTPISVGPKPAEVKKETEEVKIDDGWGDFEDAHDTAVPELPPPLPDATQKSFPQKLVEATTEQKPAEAKKETEEVKIDDGWGDFEDAHDTAIHEVSPQQQPPKAEEQKPKKADIFTNESLFDGVTPISVGISVDQKPAEVKKETEEVKIDDRWGDFEDAHNATVPELPPPLPDATQKSFPQNSVGATTEQKPDEGKKETEEVKIDDGWGDFEDAHDTIVPEVPAQEPTRDEESTASDTNTHSTEQSEAELSWGDFEGSIKSAPETEESKTEPREKKSSVSLIDWDMPMADTPILQPPEHESETTANDATSDDIFGFFTGKPSAQSTAHEQKGDELSGGVNLLDFTTPMSTTTTANTAATAMPIDITGVFDSMIGAKKEEGVSRSATVDKSLLESLIEQERFEEAIACKKDLAVQKKIAQKEKELKASGKTQPEINAGLA